MSLKYFILVLDGQPGTIWNSCINGTLCIETNSECSGGICVCRENYYEKAGRCSE